MKRTILADSMQLSRRMVCPYTVWLNQFWSLQIQPPLQPVHVQPHTINAAQWTIIIYSLLMEILCNNSNSNSTCITEHQLAPSNTLEIPITSCHTIRFHTVTMEMEHFGKCAFEVFSQWQPQLELFFYLALSSSHHFLSTRLFLSRPIPQLI